MINQISHVTIFSFSYWSFQAYHKMYTEFFIGSGPAKVKSSDLGQLFFVHCKRVEQKFCRSHLRWWRRRTCPDEERNSARMTFEMNKKWRLSFWAAQLRLSSFSPNLTQWNISIEKSGQFWAAIWPKIYYIYFPRVSGLDTAIRFHGEVLKWPWARSMKEILGRGGTLNLTSCDFALITSIYIAMSEPSLNTYLVPKGPVIIYWTLSMSLKWS